MDDYQLYRGDCLKMMDKIPDGSVDMILCDLPYGTTACPWDVVIEFEPLWAQYRRVAKARAAIVLFGAEPFSSRLRLSALDLYKYDWKWRKNRPVGFVNAKLKPLKAYEDVCVFSTGKTSNLNAANMPYFPQGLVRCNVKGTKTGNSHGENTYYRPSQDKGYTQEWTNYPVDVLEVDETGAGKKVHPTQKPVSLIEYFIRTYTTYGQTVLDNCMGSGTTGVACANTVRKFIGIEQDDKYFSIAQERIKRAYEQDGLD